MAKPMTVKQLRKAIKSLENIKKMVDDTLEAAQLCSQLNFGLYGDLSAAQAMLSGALEALAFQLERVEEEGAETNDEILDVP
jgi:hypothetical protein